MRQKSTFDCLHTGTQEPEPTELHVVQEADAKIRNETYKSHERFETYHM